MGLRKRLSHLSLTKSTPRKQASDTNLAAYFCHGRADSDGTIMSPIPTTNIQSYAIDMDHEQAKVTSEPPMDLTLPLLQITDMDNDIQALQNESLPALSVVDMDEGTEMAIATSESEMPLFFSKLPPEIRNEIYLYALIPSTPIDISTHPRVPSLLQTSQQLRSETLGLYYSHAPFTYHFQTHFWRTLFSGTIISWLESVSSIACSHINNLELQHRIIDATEQVWSAFDSFAKVSGDVERDCEAFVRDLEKLGVRRQGVRIERKVEEELAGRWRRLATAGRDETWVVGFRKVLAERE